MAEVTAMRNVCTPYPLYGLPWVVVAPLLDADGDPVSPSSPDSEISKNGDTFADCTNEATEIATSSGVVYLSLTGTELTTDIATIRIQSTGAKTTVLTLLPRKLVTIRTGTSASGGVSTSTIVLDGSASAVDDFYNGMIVAAVIDSVTEVRMITDYTGSSQTATVTPDWNTAPDNNDTFTVYLPDGVQIQQANTTHLNSTAQTARDIGASVLLSSGTGTGQLDFTSGVVKANVTQYGGSAGTFASGRPEVNTTHIAGSAVSTSSAQIGVNVVNAGGTAWGSGAITAASIATDAITAAKIADGAIDAATFATGAITAAAIAADAITDAKVASDVTIASVTGAVGSVTATVNANVVQISGNTAAADNAESYFDTAGFGHILQRTTIASLTSQTSFTLVAGSADNDAYNDCVIVVQDTATAAQKCVGVIDDYTGSTKTVTLRTDPAVFTMAVNDIVSILADRSLKPTVMNRTLDVTATGAAGLDWGNVENPTTTVGLSGTTVKTATDVETDTADIQSRLPAALGANGNIKADVRDHLGTAVATPDTAGYPKVTIKSGTGTGEISLSSGSALSHLRDGSHGGTSAVMTLERVVVASTTTNEPAIKATGNGSGAGISSTGGATGHGALLTGGATSGDGLRATAATSGIGVNAIGLGNHGLVATANSGNANGAYFVGNGTGHGLACYSGSGATGNGIYAEAVSTNGKGMHVNGSGFSYGLYVTGGPTGVGAGFLGGGTSGSGMTIAGQNGVGLAVSGTTGATVYGTAGGMIVQSGGTSDALLVQAGGSGGNGINAIGAGSDVGIRAVSVSIAGTLTVSGATTLTGAITATNASNNITLGTFTVTTNAMAWNAAWDAEVQSEVQDAIEVNRLDELLAADSDIDGAAPPTVGSVFHELMTKTTGSFTFDQTTDSLEALRDRGDAAWITATGFSTHTAADVWSAATRTLTAGTNIQLPSNGLANVTTWTVAITGNITGNLSGSVGSISTGGIASASFAAGAIDAAAIATDAIGSAELSSAACNKIADHARRRTQANVEASSDGDTLGLSSLYGFIQQAQESSVSGTTLTVKKTDGSTTLGTKTLTTDATADPVTAIA